MKTKLEELRERKVEGQFVELRPIAASDASLTLKWRQSERSSLLNRGAGDETQQRSWIASRPPNEINYVIELKQPGKPSLSVGMLSLVHIDLQNRNAESARFLIGEEEASSGVPVAVEAMKLLYEIAFDELNLQRIYGTIAADNHLMIKWQKYFGMKEEGRLRSHLFLNDKFQDAVCMGLLESEYRGLTISRMKAMMAMGKK